MVDQIDTRKKSFVKIVNEEIDIQKSDLPKTIFDQDQDIDFVIEKANTNNLTASNDFVYSCNSEQDLVVNECIDEIINTVINDIKKASLNKQILEICILIQK